MRREVVPFSKPAPRRQGQVVHARVVAEGVGEDRSGPPRVRCRVVSSSNTGTSRADSLTTH